MSDNKPVLWRCLKIAFLSGMASCVETMAIAQAEVSVQQQVVGKNLQTGESISATVVLVPGMIWAAQFDSTNSKMLVQFRGNDGKYLKNVGTLLAFDTKQNKVSWECKINYALDPEVFVTKNDFLYVDNFKCRVINKKDGSDQMSMNTGLNYVNEQLNIGLGFRLDLYKESTDRLVGIDLSSGKELWHRRVTRDYGWYNLICQGDSQVVIVSDGINAINLKTGKGWRYRAVMGDMDFSGDVIVDSAGEPVGKYITGSGIDIVSGIVSDVVADNSMFYAAFRDHLVCLDGNGKVQWRYSLPLFSASRSKIFITDTTLCLVNFGYAFHKGSAVSYGIPFVALFNKTTGKPYSMLSFNTTSNPVCCVKLRGDTLLLLFRNSLSCVSLKTGKTVLEKTFDTGEFGNFREFAGDIFFEKYGAAYRNIVASSPSSIFVLTSKGELVELNQQLEIVMRYSKRIYYRQQADGYFKLLKKDNQTVLMNDNSQEIMSIDMTGQGIIEGTILYFIDGSKLFVVDLNP